MMTLHSWLGSEAHPNQHSENSMEPPTRTSVPPSDEGVINHRGLDKWSGVIQWKNNA